MAQLKIYEVNKNKYSKIKRMDPNQMQTMLKDVYEAGIAAGQQASRNSFDAKIFLAAVSEIKGIGPDKLKQIRLAMIAAGAGDLRTTAEFMEEAEGK